MPSPANPSHDRRLEDRTDTSADCPGGLCAVGLIKSFCPTCVILGVLMLPFELVRRAWQSRR